MPAQLRLLLKVLLLLPYRLLSAGRLFVSSILLCLCQA